MGGYGQASNYALQIGAGIKPIPPLSNTQGHSSVVPDTGITVQEAIGGINVSDVENALGIQKINPNMKGSPGGISKIIDNGGLGLGGINYTEYTEAVLDRISVLLIQNFKSITTPGNDITTFQKSIRDGELVVGRKSGEKLVLYKQDITANKDDC